MRVTPIRPGHGPLALALALSFGACADMALDAGARFAPPPTTCGGDGDCAANGLGEVCRRADGSGMPVSPEGDAEGICVLPGTKSQQEVWLEVRPLSGSALPPTQHGPVSLAAGQNQQLVLAAPASASGEVVYHGILNPPQKVGRAKVRFRTARSLIPGRPLVFDTETLSESSDTLGQFAQTLPAGDYTIAVYPPDLVTDAQVIRAPPERPLDDVSVQLTGGRQFTLEVSNRNEIVAFSGRAVFERGESGSAPLAAAGLDVWAVDASVPEGLLPRPSGRTLSQSVRTDADGRFTLYLPRVPASGLHRITLQFAASPGAAAFPSFRLRTEFEVRDSMVVDEPILLGRVEEPVAVSGLVYDTRGEPVAGARVAFRTDFTERFSFATTATTDEHGRYTARLFPAAYSAIALPAADPLRLASVPLAPCPFGQSFVPEREQSVNFTCERRQMFFGEVKAMGLREPVEGVSIEAVRRPDDELEDELREQAVSEFDGSFSLALAPGVYDLTLRPPQGGKLPFKTIRGIRIERGARPPLVVVELDPAFELYGQLFSGDTSSPVAATIDAYALDERGNAFLVGVGLSQADGSYSIVLPASR